MFTAFFLQDLLTEELKQIFENDSFPDRDGSMAKLHVYKQFLPVVDVQDTEDEQEELESGLLDDTFEEVPVPYIQVILPGGKTSAVDEPGMANVLLYLCSYDKSEDRKGFEYILHMIQKIQERFEKNPAIDNYRCGDEILWEVSDHDDHPYYFGAMSMEFRIPAIKKEDRFC